MAGKTKGNANKNQTAQKRAESNASASAQPLRNPRICYVCDGAITTLGQLEPVVMLDGGKQRKRARHKGGCPAKTA